MTMVTPDRGGRPAATSAPDRTLRTMLGHYATGVTVVTTLDGDGTPAGLTVNSFTSVSLRPPIVLWCLRRDSTSRTAFERSGHYAVNILARDQANLATRFASSRPDRFTDVDWRAGVAGQPVLDGVSAWLICRLKGATIPAGDHIVLFGEVVSFRTHHSEPLVFAHGGYRGLER
ncbi:flavin reductase (DIM6/NTAB) family NADH-FMN oxidoreductase RutF [Stackebrandtia endophytica]|uniref:Flavin reductase (DIM6/NTAB) family NADH-FMN oxidoreductase RutF n=1 Tax=Stackebrandtia endophytica TaxID=1496996 RepID=A0A543B0N5_9ACTN|nr:flavin reductase family protein [Stackebrandtia endophytica]TQL78401.1 flavin reductase (DIM6/NTAB) family NADH-FMN oxidoreductase RutF [Stackebrandtia endophytica]